jgi:hypothetical protein
MLDFVHRLIYLKLLTPQLNTFKYYYSFIQNPDNVYIVKLEKLLT